MQNDMWIELGEEQLWECEHNFFCRGTLNLWHDDGNWQDGQRCVWCSERKMSLGSTSIIYWIFWCSLRTDMSMEFEFGLEEFMLVRGRSRAPSDPRSAPSDRKRAPSDPILSAASFFGLIAPAPHQTRISAFSSNSSTLAALSTSISPTQMT